jgi:hypothetical protein
MWPPIANPIEATAPDGRVRLNPFRSGTLVWLAFTFRLDSRRYLSPFTALLQLYPRKQIAAQHQQSRR